jgi:sarcosine oxidase subunit gamma
MTNAARLACITDGARTGFKGPNAVEWLGRQSLPVPSAPNSWVACPSQGYIARLGTNEFFVEADATLIAGLGTALAARPEGVYPVLREDAAFVLDGPAVHEVLAQVCNVNFAALELAGFPIIMTLMIGVAVLVLPQAAGRERSYRIWCDPSLGEFLEHELRAIVSGGGAETIRAVGMT